LKEKYSISPILKEFHSNPLFFNSQQLLLNLKKFIL
jgi:hypothetical protein